MWGEVKILPLFCLCEAISERLLRFVGNKDCIALLAITGGGGGPLGPQGEAKASPL